MTLVSPGTCSITASQAGNATYSAASVTHTFMVSLAKTAGGYMSAVGSPFATGSAPFSIATSDFNGDGFPDFADRELQRRHCNGHAGKRLGRICRCTRQSLRHGLGSLLGCSGDFNADGIKDLAIANRASNNVTVLLGSGTGQFTAASGSPFAVGIYPQSLAIGDFNRDGIQDLAVAANNDSFSTRAPLQCSWGTAWAALQPRQAARLPPVSAPNSVVAGDFNADGIQDLAVSNYIDGSVTVLLGNGSGGFTSRSGSPFTNIANPSSILEGDFNGDGVPDLAIGSYFSETVTVLLGNGAGGFTPAVGSPFAFGRRVPLSLVVGDFNGDGIQDLRAQAAATLHCFSVTARGGFTPFGPVSVGYQGSHRCRRGLQRGWHP